MNTLPSHLFRMILTVVVVSITVPMQAAGQKNQLPNIVFIMEGDTPAFLNLIDNGLAGEISPSHGGWGGRYKLRKPSGEPRPIWTNSPDTLTVDGKSYTSPHATVWRWREAYQNDFAGRMDWCIAGNRPDANHHPVAVVNGAEGKSIIAMTASPGQTLTLSAAGSSDPDGNKILTDGFNT